MIMSRPKTAGDGQAFRERRPAPMSLSAQGRDDGFEALLSAVKMSLSAPAPGAGRRQAE